MQAHAILEEVKKTPYDAMRTELEKMTQEKGLDLTSCDVFEEYLLKWAGVEERPKHARYENVNNHPFLAHRGTTQSHCLFFLDISDAALAQLLKANEKCSALNATDLTALFQQEEQELRRPALTNGHPVKVIRMEAEALLQYVLPDLKIYLNLDENRDVVLRYQAAMERETTKRKMHYTDVSKRVGEIFSLEGMSTELTDCFEETMCTVIRNSFASAQSMVVVLEGMLPMTVIGVIQSYLNVKTLVTLDAVDTLTTSVSQFQSIDEAKDSDHVDLFLTTPKGSAPLIAEYFNLMIEGSAVLDKNRTHRLDRAEFKKFKDNITHLTLSAEVLMHPAFLYDIKDAMRRYSLEAKDEYRKQSKTITMTTAECMQALTRSRVKLLEYKSHVAAREVEQVYDELKQIDVENPTPSQREELKSQLGNFKTKQAAIEAKRTELEKSRVEKQEAFFNISSVWFRKKETARQAWYEGMDQLRNFNAESAPILTAQEALVGLDTVINRRFGKKNSS